MGVVFEAVDQKLGRHVAVKLLIETTQNDSSALERFWREARAASSFNHPGICTIHELNESAETPFIVMELMEGNSLEKLYRGHVMPYSKLLEMGVQLADALDVAHRKGILHRDIKPSNIFVTNSGQAKILDFGLAKLDSTGADASTALNTLTAAGSTMGTVAYMSPEQARGEPLDARSDLFSLGVVLYEMATGRHPFAGATTAVVFDRILNESPVAPISLNPRTSDRVRDHSQQDAGKGPGASLPVRRRASCRPEAFAAKERFGERPYRAGVGDAFPRIILERGCPRDQEITSTRCHCGMPAHSCGGRIWRLAFLASSPAVRNRSP